MKKRLTLQFLFWNIIIIYIVQFIFFSVNLLAVHKGFSFSNKFYNFTFSPSEVCEQYKIKLLNSSDDFNLNNEDIKVLTDNNVWLQVLDESNKEIFNINKPQEIPKEYLAGDLVQYSTRGYKMPKPSTISAKTFEKNGQKYSVIMGFSANDTFTYTLDFTDEAFKFYEALILLTFLLTIIAGYLFSRKLATPVSDIISNIKLLSKGDFNIKTKKKIGLYKEVNENLKNLANVLYENQQERKNMYKHKEDWIVNIAHDLKTPLASINGYAQLLANKDYEIEAQDANRYGEIIIDKAAYIEDLISDLSLIYKFRNKVVPIKYKKENILDIIRETVIDILNNPIYEDRDINIDYDSEEIYLLCNKKYIKRALNNFIFNALIHNPKYTRLDINISSKNGVVLEIKDNGNGIDKEELKVLFNRYYRASNTGESHKGCGLGMAISKEIVEIHNGQIDVHSELNLGTTIIISFKN